MNRNWNGVHNEFVPSSIELSRKRRKRKSKREEKNGKIRTRNLSVWKSIANGLISFWSFSRSLFLLLHFVDKIIFTGRHIIETVSELIYTPKNEREYGTLACWARNSIGKQSEPCLFQVVPAGKLTPHINLLPSTDFGHKIVHFFLSSSMKFLCRWITARARMKKNEEKSTNA